MGEKDSKGMPLTCRAVFIIGPDKRLKLSLLYPATTGRNFDEIIRVVDSLQLTATRKEATPVDWKQGGQCMVVPSVKQEDTASLFPKGVKVHEVPSGKVYIRTTPQPVKPYQEHPEREDCMKTFCLRIICHSFI